jgi:GNAT superfamily N-acetyltransferase
MIRPLLPAEAPAARQLILEMAARIYAWQGTLAEFDQDLRQRGILSDLEDITASYISPGGLFLGAFHAGRLIGTGAVRPQPAGACEVKRLWLLEEYHGQQIGYRLMQTLIAHAREQGWHTMRLFTDRVVQTRALAFYHRLGFYEIPHYEEDPDPDDVYLEMKL